MNIRVVRRSYHRPGRLVPITAVHVRGRSIILRPGESVPWHSTQRREEVLIMLEGTLRLELDGGKAQRRGLRLSAGHCVFLPQATRHRLMNQSTRRAQYLYLTA